MRKAIDITGQRYGRLVAVRIALRGGKNSSNFWLCNCDCGNTKIAKLDRLKSGEVKSCGCLGKHAYLIGKKFGLLTVVKKIGIKTKSMNWLCDCDCGRTTEVITSLLMNGQTRSCGCLIYAGYLSRGTSIKTEDVPIELVKTYMENRKLIKILKKGSTKNEYRKKEEEFHPDTHIQGVVP